MNAPGTHVLKIRHALTKKMAFSVKTVPPLFVQMKVGALIRYMDQSVIVQRAGQVRHASKKIFA